MPPVAAPDILDLLARHAAHRPDDVAIRHVMVGAAPRDISWSELLQSSRMACELLRQSDVVSPFVPSYAGKSVEVVAMMIGAIACGKVFAGVSPKFRLPQLLGVLDACDARVALVDSAGMPALQDGLVEQERIRSTDWWWLDPPARTARSRAALEALRAQANVREIQGMLDALDPMAGGQAERLEPERAAVCLFTSGSTGAPKGVLVSWSDLHDRARAECELFSLSEADVLLSLLPFSFDVGLNQLMSSLVSGARLVILESWMPTDVLNAVAEQGVTGVSAVPSIWLSLLKAGKAFDKDGPHASLRYVTISGGNMSADRLQLLGQAARGVAIFKTYGQTESFRSTALHADAFAQRPTSVGKPFGSARVYVVRSDGSKASAGERGEVVHTGLGTMMGYLRGAELDEKRRPNPFFGPDDPSAFAIFTGDQGYLDEQGYLYLEGREDDLVKVAGNRVHLAEVAAQMANVPGVLTAEAVSVPLEGADPALAVFVVPEPSGANLTVQGLKAEAVRRLPTYMLPALIEIWPEFPLTASGKPDRQALRAQAARFLLAK